MNDKDNDLNIVKEALRQTELRLEDLEKNKRAAERRLVWLTTTLFAFATALLLYLPNVPHPLSAVISSISIIVIIGAIIRLGSPTKFEVRGHFWADWKGHIDDADQYIVTLISQAEENDQRIKFNEDILNQNARNVNKCFTVLIWIAIFFASSQITAFFTY